VLISLDYDDTYTRDPCLWNTFVEAAALRGHTVIVVTMRGRVEGAEVEAALKDRVHSIVFTDRRAKKPFMEGLGYNVDVWIDDMPFFVLNSATPTSPSWPN
jgi:hypothetical protein